MNIWVVLAIRTSCEHLFTGIVSSFFATEGKSGNKIILYFHVGQRVRVPGFSPPTSERTFSCAHDVPVSFSAFSFPGHLPWKPSFLPQHTQGSGTRVSATDWTVTGLYLYIHDISQTFGSTPSAPTQHVERGRRSQPAPQFSPRCAVCPSGQSP